MTAANASPLSDGACALIIASESAASDLGLTVYARIRGFADASKVF